MTLVYVDYLRSIVGLYDRKSGVKSFYFASRSHLAFV
jgi:hypothetical protein